MKSPLQRLKDAKTRGDLASLLEIELKNLTYLLYKLDSKEKYSSFQIPKKNGGYREIQAPSESLKSLQRRASNLLEDCLQEIETEHTRNAASHGFRRGRSILTNASIHRNRRYVLNLDLENFFPTITFPRVRGFLMTDRRFALSQDVSTALAQIACVDGKLPQGSPLSPTISNLIGGILDFHLSRLARTNGCRYTRYADDLTFSTSKIDFPPAIALRDSDHEWKLGRELCGLIKKAGFSVNDGKTRMQYRTSRQQVTGLVVNKRISVPYEYRRLVRSYVHELVTKGHYFVESTDTQHPSAASKQEGSTKKLHGMLGFIHSVNSAHRAKIQKHNYNHPGVFFDDKKPTGDLAIYRRFLFYTHFFANSRPLVICEGKTDNVYLSNAIHQRKREFPLLIEKGENGKDVLSFQMFKYARRHHRENIVYLPNFSTAKILGNASGGGPNLAGLIRSYEMEARKFKGTDSSNPVIVVVDNDSGKAPVFETIAKLTGKRPSGHEPYIHVFGNLYVIPIPLGGRLTACIEDLFDEKDKLIVVNGRPLDLSNDPDSDAAGKGSFAFDYVAKHPEKVDWSGFNDLLNAISSVIAEYRTIKRTSI